MGTVVKSQRPQDDHCACFTAYHLTELDKNAAGVP